MLTYCFRCKKHTDNIYPKKLIMVTNRGNKGKSRCANCMANNRFPIKIMAKWVRDSCVSILIRFNLIKQNMLIYCGKCRKKKPQKI